MPDDRSTSTPIDRALADILVSAYKGRRMSQADLVDATGIKTATMQRLMAGKSRFDIDQLFAIADAIGTKTAAEYVAEAEREVAAHHVSGAPANVTHINTRKGADWQGEQHAIEDLDAVAKTSVVEIAPDDVTP